jgi:rhodanese-related sulfurtransferase
MAREPIFYRAAAKRSYLSPVGKIDGAVHMPIDDPRDRLSELDRDKQYLPFCAVGYRVNWVTEFWFKTDLNLKT